MKLKIYTLIFCCLLSTSLSWSDEEIAATPIQPKTNLIGAGMVVTTTPYEKVGTQVFGVPIVVWRNEHFFIKGLKGGWIFAENDTWRGDVFLTPRLMGYDADDSDSLNGMENRDLSLDGGAQIKWKVPEVEDLTLNLAAMTDLLSKSKGQEVSLSAQKKFLFDFYQIVPEIGFKWQSSDLVKYYYGVRDSEVASGRPAYEPDSTINPFVNLEFYMGLSKEWRLITRFSHEFLGGEIQDSPIVNKEGLFSGVIGLARCF